MRDKEEASEAFNVAYVSYMTYTFSTHISIPVTPMETSGLVTPPPIVGPKSWRVIPCYPLNLGSTSFPWKQWDLPQL